MIRSPRRSEADMRCRSLVKITAALLLAVVLAGQWADGQPTSDPDEIAASA
jgi:hypothetical protein